MMPVLRFILVLGLVHYTVAVGNGGSKEEARAECLEGNLDPSSYIKKYTLAKVTEAGKAYDDFNRARDDTMNCKCSERDKEYRKQIKDCSEKWIDECKEIDENLRKKIDQAYSEVQDAMKRYNESDSSSSSSSGEGGCSVLQVGVISEVYIQACMAMAFGFAVKVPGATVALLYQEYFCLDFYGCFAMYVEIAGCSCQSNPDDKEDICNDYANALSKLTSLLNEYLDQVIKCINDKTAKMKRLQSQEMTCCELKDAVCDDA